MASIKFNVGVSVSDPDTSPVTIIGQVKHLTQLNWDDVKVKLEPRVSDQLFRRAVGELSSCDTMHMYLNLATLATLPAKCSRHNTPSRAHSVTKVARSLSRGVDETLLMVCERGDIMATACAVGRAYPLYSRKTGCNALPCCTVSVEFLLVDTAMSSVQGTTQQEMELAQHAVDSVRMAARIVDMPANEMNTDTFVQEIESVGRELGCAVTLVRGEELKARGFGGIYGVGKAAERPPCLAVLSHRPAGARYNIAWVGKGIVYDTGGLSMKTKTSMPGMKRDLGGAAGILGAFRVAVRAGFSHNLHAVLCVAENAVAPTATRPDDVHLMYSGRTVEINNTDAEGRLVLADGVAYASKDLNCSIIVDMATLTGAQGAATGKFHGAVLSNRESWECCAVSAGRSSGELLFPVPYAPELHFVEFASSVADMKNSVADRSNALTSCAGLFIAAHLGFDFPGVWLHVDMASPSHVGERATGYGVALLPVLFGAFSSDKTLQQVAPAIPACIDGAGETDDGNNSGGDSDMAARHKKIKRMQH